MQPPSTIADNMCHSCGMPMSEPDQRGGMIADNPNCVYCTDEQGKLKPYEAVLGGMANFMARSESIEVELATERSRKYLTRMPAWRDRGE